MQIYGPPARGIISPGRYVLPLYSQFPDTVAVVFCIVDVDEDGVGVFHKLTIES